jgi:N-acetyl-1-D-myo-inositol-2-amino-2-deoxy-alpha-D-glucopyranoside deacetylase
MAVHAHPDDEVFSTGGILARYSREGVRTIVVYCTTGEEGEMRDPARDPEEAIPMLAEIRRREAEEATAILGVSDVVFLGYRDSGMAGTDANANPENFHNADLDEAVERLMSVMEEMRPQVIVTYDEHGGYGHPDHIKANVVATEAFKRAQGRSWAPQKLYYAARSREGFRRQVELLREHGESIPWVKDDFNFDEYGVPNAEITAHVDVSSLVSLKREALRVHRTQVTQDSFYFRLPDGILSQAAGTEYFVRVFPPPVAGEREDDLFVGVAQEALA